MRLLENLIESAPAPPAPRDIDDGIHIVSVNTDDYIASITVGLAGPIRLAAPIGSAAPVPTSAPAPAIVAESVYIDMARFMNVNCVAVPKTTKHQFGGHILVDRYIVLSNACIIKQDPRYHNMVQYFMNTAQPPLPPAHNLYVVWPTFEFMDESFREFCRTGAVTEHLPLQVYTDKTPANERPRLYCCVSNDVPCSANTDAVRGNLLVVRAYDVKPPPK